MLSFVINSIHSTHYIQIFIFTGFIINILLETTEKGEPPPSGLGSPTLFKYIITLSFILSSIDSIYLVLLIVILNLAYATVSFVAPLKRSLIAIVLFFNFTYYPLFMVRFSVSILSEVFYLNITTPRGKFIIY
jgi:hypothetical protein